MNNLIEIRKIADVNPKIMSKLLNVTVHTYLAFEKAQMEMPKEILKMISMIFRVDEETIDSSKSLSEDTVEQLREISSLSAEDKIKYLASGILGESTAVNYRNISIVKNKLRTDIYI